MDNYLVQTRSQARSSGIKVPEVHYMRKNLDPNIKPEKQYANPIRGSVVKLYIGQGRAGLNIINQTINQPSELTENSWQDQNRNSKNKLVHSKDPVHTINNADTEMTHIRPLIPDVPFYPGLSYRPPPNLLD